MDANEHGASDGSGASPDLLVFDVRHISASQLARLGVSELAYVKPVVVNGAIAYAIHSADGTPMAIAPARDLAMAAIRQHEMIPVLVH